MLNHINLIHLHLKIIFGTDKGKLIQIPSDSECNIAIFGPPGSGKTSGIAIINAMSFQGSVLAVDVKGDLYNYVSKHTNRKIVRFCPDSPTALKGLTRSQNWGKWMIQIRNYILNPSQPFSSQMRADQTETISLQEQERCFRVSLI